MNAGGSALCEKLLFIEGENVMHYLLKRYKDKLYYYMVDKNWGIGPEYHRYVESHQEEHQSRRWKSWWILVQLNWHYRVLRKKKPLLYDFQPKANYPYMGGAESHILNRIEAHYFARELLTYDIISFDIFDTLVLRPFATPQDLFYIVGERLNFNGFNNSFYGLRRLAEKEARDIVQINRGHREVNIYDIYEQLSKYTDIEVEEGVKNELAVEEDYCFANPYMLRVFNILKEQGKKIVFVSDMYFPEILLERILRKCGYVGYDKIYVSCDYGASKARGELYKIVLEKVGMKRKFVHIGDNRISDIKRAQECGIETRWYPNVQEVGKKYRAGNMSKIIGSFYAGIINSYLYNGVLRFNFYYEYGFIYAGIYILGMCKWIHDKVHENNIDKIIFLSRDGALYKKVYDLYYKNTQSEYCYWSRLANMKYVVVKRNYKEFIDRFVTYRINDSHESNYITMKSLLESLELSSLENKLKNHGITTDTPVINKYKNEIIDFFIAYKAEITTNYDQEKVYVINLYKQCIKSAKRIALVDVGWSGHNLLGLKYLIQHEIDPRISIKCWMACEKAEVNHKALLSRELDTYIFSSFVNKDIPNRFHNKVNSKINTPFFEVVTQEASPSFCGYDKNGKMSFDIPTVEDYQINKEMEQGVLDFCDLYFNFSKNDIYLRNIPGRDAYAPFSHAVCSIEFIKKNFSNIHLAMNIGSNNELQAVESFDVQFKFNEK